MTSSVHPSSSSSTSFTVRELCLAAVMAAVVFLATFVPRIPIPLGYAHLGDAAIFLMVLFLGRRETLIAACFGSALSDLLGGFPLWIVPTLIIKYFMADIAWRVIRPDQKRASLARLVVGFLLASAWMAAAYTLFGAMLYDSLAAGLASAPGLIAEGVLNSAIAVVAAGLLQKTPLGRH